MGEIIEEATGHSRQLRLNLKAARERAELSQDRVGELVAERLGRDRPYTGASISAWETFAQHPPIDVMAAWARVVGLRLVVEIDDGRGDRIPVLVHRRTADLARALDVASDKQREFVRSYLEQVDLL